MTVRSTFTAASVAHLLAGCAPDPSPELLAAVTNPSTQPAALAPHLVDACLAEARIDPSRYAVVTNAFSPGLSARMGSQFENALFCEDMQSYATDIRAYRLDLLQRWPGLFGEVRQSVACYAAPGEGGVRFIAALRADAEGRVPAHEFSTTSLTIYARLSGKSEKAVRLLGCQAG